MQSSELGENTRVDSGGTVCTPNLVTQTCDKGTTKVLCWPSYEVCRWGSAAVALKLHPVIGVKSWL